MPLRREIHAAQEVLEVRGGARGLFQLCVFRLGFLQNGNVGVGVFPEGKNRHGVWGCLTREEMFPPPLKHSR